MGDAEAIRASLHQHVNVQIRATVTKYQSQLASEVVVREDNAIASFQSLLAAISQTPHRLYLLIDEYDNFANEVLVSHQQGAGRYQELVGGEGAIKTLFKAIKDAAEGRGLDRVFITGVSPVVLADITSGYNVVEDISREPEYADLCGFHEAEIRAVLEQVVSDCKLPPERAAEALDLMRTFYNGYHFSLEPEGGQIYNPTLALYFLKHLADRCHYPEEMLDNNLAMDRNRIEYIARLPRGEEIVSAALDRAHPLSVDRLEQRFGVERMLHAPQTEGFLASLLYFFGVLTYSGRDPLGKLQLSIPNLVVRKLYVERIQEALLPGYNLETLESHPPGEGRYGRHRERRSEQRYLPVFDNRDLRWSNELCDRFYAGGELAGGEPLCDFIEQRYLPVFDNRDLRWSNELVVKTAFLVTLFNDIAYIMDSETAIARGYCDLSLIVRPDRRQYALLDHVIEFKHLKVGDLPGLDSEAIASMPREALRARPEVARLLSEANTQLAGYRKTLEGIYGDKLKLRTHAVACIGLLRFVW